MIFSVILLYDEIFESFEWLLETLVMRSTHIE